MIYDLRFRILKNNLISYILHPTSKRGFTLVELLVVIAVLGIISTIVLIAINPLNRIQEGKDAGRVTAIGQLSNAVQSYYTGQGGVYLAANSTWINTLISSNELKNLPSQTDYLPGTDPCSGTSSQRYFCYNTNGTEAIIYTTLEADSNKSRCENSPGTTTYFLWSSSQSQAGIVCEVLDPGTAGKFSGFTFIP